MEDNITQIRSGLHKDNSFIEQPKDTLRFALNAVGETNEGDQTFIANEESNELCFQLPDTYIPLGQVYIGNNETVIFSVKDDETLSEIGIADADCNYTTIVNADLGFILSNQIDATFRLRRGCERVIYWVDPKVRYFNIDKPQDFKSAGSSQAEIDNPLLNWEVEKFLLFRQYSDIPNFDSFEVEEGGTLTPGSYNFSIQYLDSNLNPTEFILSSEVINIYNDNQKKEYNIIRGSSTIKNDYKDFPNTNKSIKINLSNLDQNFTFYRIAIIEATNSTGQVSNVRLSPPIGIETLIFNYTGINFESEIPIEEVQQFTNIISEAKHIEQIENRLVIANTKGSPVNLCKLQKYASQITADLVIDTVRYRDPIEGSYKDPTIRTQNKIGHMPGEIYSFGIQYYFEDNTLSPVYHIPGRNASYVSDMSDDNELGNTFYTDNSACEDYWGQDSEGGALLGEPVRHHRFPLRTEVDEHYLNFSTKTVKNFGISFSNILTPSLIDTNGVAITGYQIVRQERNSDNKTIIDTAILTPIIEETKYASNAILLAPTADKARIKSDIFGYISMEASFKNERIRPTQIIAQGYVTQGFLETNSVLTQDVAPGTSWDPDIHTRKSKDADGFTLHTLTNYHATNAINNGSTTTIYADEADIEDVFFLNALESKTITDISATSKDIFNLQADNKANFIQLNKHLVVDAATTQDEFDEQLPVVVLKRNLSDPYANFRLDPYYAATGVIPIASSSVDVYNGDTYTNTLVYHSTTHYDVRLGGAHRPTKSGLWNAVIGVLSAVVGVVLIATGVGIPAGLMAIGFGLSQIAAGIKKENISKVYQDLYEDGLRTTVESSVIDPVFQYANTDDELQWYSEILSSLHLETSVNISLREGATQGGVTDFIDDGTLINTTPATLQPAAERVQEYYLINKLTVTDSNTEAGKLYRGYPVAEVYDLNPDFNRPNKGKIFFHLGIEYDCCSSCVEEFPHRIHYSQQSFQEELIDNYRTFLPNNFRDIEGEKGVINDIFKIQNNLYIHTEEALFHLPQNIQERVTGDIVSFIGTGDFFSIPPRKVVDHDKSSAGTLNKWSRVKTPYGVFFISLIDRAIYKFSGESLEPISNNGLFNWFKENLPFKGQDDFNGNIDNPSNPNGLGFISVYDSRKERIIFTKKDFTNPLTTNEDNSWSISYSLKDNSFTSWHSYLPSFYFFINNEFFSWDQDIARSIYKHNVKGSYQSFYGILYPHIIEYVSNPDALLNKIFENITLHTEAKVYDPINDYFINNRNRTFNKAILYNSRQCSGELTLFNKDINLINPEDYLQNQVKNLSNLNIPIDNNEGIWTFNGFRDIVIDLSQPIFIKSTPNLQSNYFIDKILNNAVLDENKDWTQQESFRSKYLVVRLIFDNFTDTRLITNYSVESENKSFR